MRILQKVKDGGPKSNVDAFVLIEIKSLFSIILLRFNKGSRDNFHNHAFNAYTYFLSKEGCAYESYTPTGKVLFYKPFTVKYTPRHLLHKVVALKTCWALTFRGPWSPTWKEYDPKTDQTITFTHGRKKVKNQ